MNSSVKQIVLLIPALTSILCIPGRCQDTLPPTTAAPTGQPLAQTARPDPVGTLDFGQKFHYFADTTFTFGTVLGAAATAGFQMVDPPSHYPRQWVDGGEAYGRNLGDALAVTGTLLTGKFIAGAALGEDPRYFPSHSGNPAARLVHALAFTFIDRSDHGTNRLAISNFAGAAAAGFVGEAYLPNGFNDNVHAYQRGFIAFGVLGFRNIGYEFRPELRELGHRMHVIRNP